jgi:hypothetical protein
VRHFVEASRRMAASLDQPPAGPRRDPGKSLIELLDFAEQITAWQPVRQPEPLRFPLMAGLAEQTAAHETAAHETAAHETAAHET